MSADFVANDTVEFDYYKDDRETVAAVVVVVAELRQLKQLPEPSFRVDSFLASSDPYLNLEMTLDCLG